MKGTLWGLIRFASGLDYCKTVAVSGLRSQKVFRVCGFWFWALAMF